MATHMGEEIWPTNEFRAQVERILRQPDASSDPEVSLKERVNEIVSRVDAYYSPMPREKLPY